MFRRALPPGNQSPLGNKDRKRLRETLLNNFPLLTESDVDLLVPKEGVVQSRLNLPQVPKPAGGGPQQPGALTPLLSSTSTNKCTLYSVGDITFLAEVNGIFFPTVHALWRLPKMLPCMILLSPVSHFVLKGADLMLPGVCRPLTVAAAHEAGVRKINCGELWAIRVAGNALPFAVGRAVATVPSLELLGDKGRILELMHCLGDALWKHGKPTPLPPLFTFSQVFSGGDDAELLAACGMGPPESLPGARPSGQQQEQQQEEQQKPEVAQETDVVAESCSGTDPDGHESAGGAAAEPETEEAGGGQAGPLAASGDEGPPKMADQGLTVEEQDKYLALCLLETLHAISDDQLPLDVSALYSKLTAAAPAIFYTKMAKGDVPFVAPDIRRSSAKKLAKFIQGATKQKLLQTKEQRGVVSVVKINRSHPEYCKHTPVPENRKKKYIEKATVPATASVAGAAGTAVAAEEETPRGTQTAVGTAASSSGPLLLEFCAPPAKCCRIFAAVGARTGKNVFFTADEYRQVLVKYLEQQDTKREEGETSEPPPGERCNSVKIDPLLAEAVLTKEEMRDAKMGEEERLLMDKGEVFVRWKETALPCHAVLRDESELPLLQERIVRGACTPVRISVEEKQGGRKHATHILNATNFLVEPKTLAEFLQKKLAASASVYAPPGTKVTSGVCVQGNVARQVADLLVSQFGIPKKFVEIDTKKPKSSR